MEIQAGKNYLFPGCLCRTSLIRGLAGCGLTDIYRRFGQKGLPQNGILAETLTQSGNYSDRKNDLCQNSQNWYLMLLQIFVKLPGNWDTNVHNTKPQQL